MPKITLHYMDFPFWRAEVARLALHLGKVGVTMSIRVGSKKVKLIVATCSLAPMWVMVIECLWDTFWPDPFKDLRFRRL